MNIELSMPYNGKKVKGDFTTEFHGGEEDLTTEYTEFHGEEEDFRINNSVFLRVLRGF